MKQDYPIYIGPGLRLSLAHWAASRIQLQWTKLPAKVGLTNKQVRLQSTISVPSRVKRYYTSNIVVEKIVINYHQTILFFVMCHLEI